MWIHIFIFLCFCGLFLCAKGLFSKSGIYLAGKIPKFFHVTAAQIRVFLLIAFWGNVLGLTVTSLSYLENGSSVRALKRQEESYTEEIYVSDGVNREKIAVEVQKEPYTDVEKMQILEEVYTSLETEILGENQSLDRVEYPLDLMTEKVGTPVTIQWDTDQPLILDWEGQIGEAVPEEGTVVHLRAELKLEEYSRLYEVDVRVYPQKLSDSEQFVQDVQEEIRLQNEKQGTYLYLPMYVNGKELTWVKTDRYQGLFLSGMAVVIGVLVVLSEKSKEKQDLKRRQMEMQADYPGILNKMILLIQAGMSSRRAIQKMALDYQADLKCGRRKRYGYEAVLSIYWDMEKGISEEQAYRNLADRCDLLCYRTLSTLLIQNLKKGSSYFISALKQECTVAFEERKSRALIRGEEAGTKMLAPMGGMLLIVLLIILVPSMMVLG